MPNPLLRLLRGEQTEVIPAAPLYLGLYLEDFVRNFYAEQYALLARPSGAHKVTHDEDTLLRARALYQAYGIFKSPPDWISVRPGASYAWADRMQIRILDDEPYYHELDSGVQLPMRNTPLPMGDQRLEPNPKYEADIWDASEQIKDEADLERLLPLRSTQDILADGSFELARRVLADYGAQRFIHTVQDTPYSDSYDLLGFQGMMVIQRQRPEFFHALLQRKLAQSEQVLGAWAAVGLHGIFVEETFSGADMISPPHFEAFVLRYNQPYFECIRRSGMCSIYYLCGDVLPRIEEMVGLEIDAVAVEESKKNFAIPIEEVARRVAGRKLVFGNIDAVQFGLHADREAMRREVVRQARAGVCEGAFVVSTGSPFPLDTNPRLVDTLIDTAHELSSVYPQSLHVE